jgi:hypothetical protein
LLFIGLRVNILWLNGTPAISLLRLHRQEIEPIQKSQVHGLKRLRRLVEAGKFGGELSELLRAQVTSVVLYRDAASGTKRLDEDVYAVRVGCQRGGACYDDLVGFWVGPKVGILEAWAFS